VIDNKITHADGTISHLNSRLIIQQKLDQATVDLLKATHLEKDKLFEQMKATDNPITLRMLALDVTNVEFAQQELWGFPQNANFHYWFNVPKCKCPKMDNRDAYGTSYQVVSEECPIHGWNLELLNNG
jgi:hypothetical protein